MNRVSFILPAAGDGLRMKAPVPKPFLELGGIPLIIRTLNQITQLPGIAEIVVVLPPSRFEELSKTYGQIFSANGATRLVPGGASRQESVSLGLAALTKDCELVAVHDAVRCFASVELMQRLCEVAAQHGGAIPILPVIDTLKKCSDHNLIQHTVSRRDLFKVQTPQVFSREKIESAYSRAGEMFEATTDDASVLEAAGEVVVGVPGELFNLKITTPDDLLLAEALLKSNLV